VDTRCTTISRSDADSGDDVVRGVDEEEDR
jgi:hypothetical protein